MSIRLRLTNFFAHRLARPFIAKTQDPAAARRQLERVTRALPIPAAVKIEKEAAGAEWLRVVPKTRSGAPTILYFHGGAYIAGSPRTHLRLAAQLALAAGSTVILPRYRLAPEHPAPAAFDDALAAYQSITNRDGPVVLGGDSAGGGLAFSVLAASQFGLPKPSGVFAFSPFTDLTLRGEARTRLGANDRLLPLERFDEICGYLGSQLDPADERLSPALAQYQSPPPVLIQVARSEGLYPDAVKMTDALRKGGGAVTLRELEDAPHVWQMMDLWLPEARTSIAEVGAFVRSLSP